MFMENVGTVAIVVCPPAVRLRCATQPRRRAAHLGSPLRQILQVNIVLGTPGKCLFSTAAMLLATASSRLRTILGPVRVGSYPSSSVMSRSLRLLTPPLSDVVAFQMGRRQGALSRTGVKGPHS